MVGGPDSGGLTRSANIWSMLSMIVFLSSALRRAPNFLFPNSVFILSRKSAQSFSCSGVGPGVGPSSFSRRTLLVSWMIILLSWVGDIFMCDIPLRE